MFTFFIRSSCWEWFGLDCDLPCDFALNSKSLGHTKWAKYFANTLNSIQYCIVINPNAFWISTLIFGSFFVYCFNHHCVAISNLNERERNKNVVEFDLFSKLWLTNQFDMNVVYIVYPFMCQMLTNFIVEKQLKIKYETWQKQFHYSCFQQQLFQFFLLRWYLLSIRLKYARHSCE